MCHDDALYKFTFYLLTYLLTCQVAILTADVRTFAVQHSVLILHSLHTLLCCKCRLQCRRTCARRIRFYFYRCRKATHVSAWKKVEERIRILVATFRFWV